MELTGKIDKIALPNAEITADDGKRYLFGLQDVAGFSTGDLKLGMRVKFEDGGTSGRARRVKLLSARKTPAGESAPSDGGFPAGNFKIKNVETGQCLQSFLGKVGDTRYASDGKGGLKTEEHPQAGRNIPYMDMRPCSDTRDQAWRYNATSKRLESVGQEGRIASLGPNMTMADAMSGSQIIDPSSPPAPERDDAGWRVGLESRDTSSTPKMLQFKTVDGYIMLADPLAQDGDEEETYWTAEGDGDLVGRPKGRPGQKWTFPKAP